MRQLETVALDDARRVIAAGEQKAREIGSPSNVAVVDVGGNLVAHIRMDDAWMGSIDISINKAFTARAFDTATADLATNSQPGGQFFGIAESNHGRVMIFAGGMPLHGSDGNVVGGVGVSGGTGEQDRIIVEAAAAAF
ncbi:heme-binding protein [Actinomycetospora sp. NBRC 106378]|uniref:GlcG/HbpS family heme-binding protein n=1 Tax=Actinomycetospora sp. NBRC 106378 TaxID=3032208 RepID=UPI00249FA2B1|nr:heme-binding protein [Actinomycetospora sp. NBRC 106378]GLZ54636.1 ATP--cob(I)alamin adenosyltransferase [Actinomycetospora sp. NBRC 106378]